MSDDTVIRELMQAAVSGVSKTQVFRHMKEKYKLNDEDVNELVKSCKFKQQPKKIDYNRFYDISATKIAKKIEFPFTQIYLSDNFLPKDNCKKLIELIASQVRPSTISNSEDKKITSDYRTSKTADLHYFHSPFVNSLDWKICKFMGLDPFLGETLQAQSYLPGEYYKEHHDFFHPKTKECSVYTEWMGQRTWTFFCYLNDVEEGGETYFKHLKLKIKPKAGTVVIWNNLYKNGLPNYKTAHEALPPVSGNKYVITKWFRSWPLI